MIAWHLVADLEMGITLGPRLAALAWEGGLRICFQSPHDRLGRGAGSPAVASLFAAVMLLRVSL